MTQHAISQFFAAIAADVDAQEALRAPGASRSAFVSKAAELAAQKGYALSHSELAARLPGSRASTSQELSLEELDAVAGGGHTDTFTGCGLDTSEWACKTNTKIVDSLIGYRPDQLLNSMELVQPNEYVDDGATFLPVQVRPFIVR